MVSPHLGGDSMPADPNRVKDLFLAAVDRPETDRPHFLDGQCEGDTELRTEVERLLAAHNDPDSRIERAAGEAGTPSDTASFPAATSTFDAGLAGDGRGSLPTSAPPGYELLEVLGRGGMGIVYKARQTALQRIVALKLVLTGAHASADERQRFLAEAETVAAINHSGIVGVYEFGSWDGHLFLALEFCPGGTLADKLRGTPLSAAEAAGVVSQLASALDPVHARGIVHRDLKPSNILLTAEGAPKVADFGLAKVSDSEAGLTATGAILGTPSYMAPEQARGDTRNVGTAADIYALGAVLYECLTGRPPLWAPTAAETLLQVLHQEPVSVRALNSSVPVDLETVCAKCLEKDPGKRYASARELAGDLRAFLEGRPVTARPVGWAGRLRRWGKRNPG